MQNPRAAEFVCTRNLKKKIQIFGACVWAPESCWQYGQADFVFAAKWGTTIHIHVQQFKYVRLLTLMRCFFLQIHFDRQQARTDGAGRDETSRAGSWALNLIFSVLARTVIENFLCMLFRGNSNNTTLTLETLGFGFSFGFSRISAGARSSGHGVSINFLAWLREISNVIISDSLIVAQPHTHTQLFCGLRWASFGQSGYQKVADKQTKSDMRYQNISLIGWNARPETWFSFSKHWIFLNSSFWKTMFKFIQRGKSAHYAPLFGLTSSANATKKWPSVSLSRLSQLFCWGWLFGVCSSWSHILICRS